MDERGRLQGVSLLVPALAVREPVQRGVDPRHQPVDGGGVAGGRAREEVGDRQVGGRAPQLLCADDLEQGLAAQPIGLARVGRRGHRLEHARLACKSAKQRGRDQTEIYVGEHDARIAREIESGWTDRLRTALEQERFIFLVQPIVPLAALPISQSLPWGTIIINITGSFLIGLFVGLMRPPSGRWLATSNTRVFFTYGICGGYTTFSSFSLQTLDLLREGEWLHAGANVVLSVVLCMIAVWLGYALAMTLNKFLKGA